MPSLMRNIVMSRSGSLLVLLFLSILFDII